MSVYYHTTKRQKSRAGQESLLGLNPYFIFFDLLIVFLYLVIVKLLSSTIIICFTHINFYLSILISFVLFKRIVNILKLLSECNELYTFLFKIYLISS